MIGVVLAGGLGSRLHPLTLVTNKHLLPIFDKPMIWFPLHYMAEMGIKRVVIITGDLSGGEIMRYAKNGQEWGFESISYAHQDGNTGIPAALALAKTSSNNEPLLVILGDNLFGKKFSAFLRKISKYISDDHSCAHIILNYIKDDERIKKFGVARFSGLDGRVIDIIEKPKTSPSHWAVTGCYIFPSNVFDIIKTLKPSARGELEVTDIQREYIKRTSLVTHNFKGKWTDAGTIDSLHRACVLRHAGVL